MKKFWMVMVVIMVMMSSVIAFATNPSATGSIVKVVTETFEGQDVSGLIVTSDGSVIQGVVDSEEIWIKVTDVSVASDELSEESTIKLENAITQLDSITSILDVIDVADIPEDTDHENIVAVAVMDIDVSDEIKTILAANPGSSVKVTIEVEAPAGAGVLVLHNYADDLWEVLESENNGNGTVTVRIGENGFSPVAVYIDTANVSVESDAVVNDDVETNTTDDVEDDTEDDTEDDVEVNATDEVETEQPTMAIVVVVCIAIFATLIVVLMQKRKKKES